MGIHFLRQLSLVACIVLAGHGGVGAQDKDPLEPISPAVQRGDAKKLTSPVKVTDDVIAEGKELFENKGSCFNCHGKSGKGDSPAGGALKPANRDLTNCKRQDKWSDGEMFFNLKNGIPGTGMTSHVPVTLNEEEAWKVIAYVRTFCK